MPKFQDTILAPRETTPEEIAERIRRAAAERAAGLDLRRLILGRLPTEIGDLTHLRYLGLSGSVFTEIPAWIGRLTALEHLNLRYAHIGGPPSRTKAEHLSNPVNSEGLVLPKELAELRRLQTLDLFDTNLDELPNWIGDLRELRSLDLSYNYLSRLPASLGLLTNLTELDIEDNLLTELPAALGELRNLTTFKYLRNPLTFPPPEVTRVGHDAVLIFLRSAAQSKVRQWSAKVVVVGEGAVGKTSLVKALSGQPHDRGEPTTHGMEISSLELPHPREAGVTMELSVWDFGGQDIYHATHQFFLTDRALFILVWNVRMGTEGSRLHYWLNIVTARAPEAPILLVATHTADRPADLDLAGLRAAYPRIVGTLSVDNATRDGVFAMMTRVRELAAELPLMGAAWPRTWVAAAKALTTSDDAPDVTADRMRELMASAGLTEEEEQRSLALALHHRGQILYHEDDDDLADIVIREPKWLNQRISSLLDRPEVAHRSGVLTRAGVAAAWPGIDQTRRQHLLTMMDRYDLSYRIREARDGSIAIVVSWLPQAPPDYHAEWDAALAGPGAREMRVVYEMAVLPPGIPGWFLARSHRFATPWRWRTGAVLRHPDGRHFGLLRAIDARVELTVRGPVPAPFFALLDDGLNVTFDRYPGLSIRRWLVCPGHGGAACPRLFDYDRVVKRVDNGHATVYCDEADEPVPIETLLLGVAPTTRHLIGVDLQRLFAEFGAQLRADIVADAGRTQQEFLKLRTQIQRTQQVHCPSVFTIVSARRVVGTRHVLRLYCEEPGAWHPLPGDTGCYEIHQLPDILRKVGPHLARTLRLLRGATPIVGAVMGMAADEVNKRLRDDLELAKALLDAAGELLSDPSEIPTGGNSASARTYARDDADFRVLRSLLTELDPRQHWGGLSYLTTPEGLSIYVCADHLAAYRTAAAI